LVAGKRASSYTARREVLRQGATLAEATILTRGWAAQVRDFPDGRRQILHLLLPGDMISIGQEPGGYAPSTTLTLTDARIAPAPKAESYDSGLGQAYALSASIERSCLLRQNARIGRLDAFERLADLFLELAERLRHAALTASDSFELPLTQETLADCLGLTPVHLNRTLQHMRREGMIEDRQRIITLMDADRLRSIVDYRPLTATGQDG
jgi:CRP-like cAMP-binding protein